MFKRTRTAFLIVASLLMISAFVPASTRAQVLAASTEELSRRAEVIAVGKVSGLVSEWNDAHTMIRTRVTMSVDQYVKGGVEGSALTLYIPGGEVDGVGEVYSDMPRFRVEEEVLVFANKDVSGQYRIAGGDQGKYSIQRDAVTGKLSVAGNKPLEDFTSSVRKALQVQIMK